MGSGDTDRMYMCIDLKCFYASVECADLGLDPFTTPLVVADGSRGKDKLTTRYRTHIHIHGGYLRIRFSLSLTIT